MRFSRKNGYIFSGLISFFLSFQSVVNSLKNNLNIEEKTPVFKIKNIVFNPVDDVIFSFHFSAVTAHLSQTGYSGFNKMPDHELVDPFGIHVGMADHVWPGPHHT